MDSKTLSFKVARLVLIANVKEAPFKCVDCKKVFISENHLRRHEERRHIAKDTSQEKGTPFKEDVNGTAVGPTIKAVLNATERIEDLVKLAMKETENPYNLSFTLSSPKNVVEENSLVLLNSPEKSFLANNKSQQTLNDQVKQVPKLKHYDFLEEKENEALSSIPSSAVETCSCSNQVLNPVENTVKEEQDTKINAISSLEDSFADDKSCTDNRSRLKEKIIENLNKKLESFGITCDQSRLSDKEMSRIGQLLKEERSHIAEKSLEYYQLRDLIKSNAERRIGGNLLNGL